MTKDAPPLRIFDSSAQRTWHWPELSGESVLLCRIYEVLRYW